MVEYGQRGLVGLLTPQANTTAEPELAVLWPPGVAMVSARMVSAAPGMEDRLRDYFAALGPAVAQFANAPLSAIAVACTGASYLTGRTREAALVAELEAARGIPVITSGRAVGDAFQVLGARRVGLVSPYPPGLTRASVAYWQEGGVEVAEVVEIVPDAGAFHPVYVLPAADAATALHRLAGVAGLDAVAMMGTGLATLPVILDHPRCGRAPVISSLLATAWRTMLAIGGDAPSRDNLLAWVDSPAWAPRLRDRLG